LSTLPRNRLDHRFTLAHARGAILGALALGALLAATAPGHAASVASVFSGRVPCRAQDGVQFCSGSLTARIPSWDGVPLDVDVTLPSADQDGPFPLVVELHGWSQGKAGRPFVDRAREGYAVLNYSARGFHASCGSPTARAPDPSLPDPDVCVERGWTHLSDARFEARDTQYLAGLLADEGLVIPDRIGVTGGSYGGGQSLILASLRDRVMLPNGSLVPWTSPGGLPMRIAAAAPIVPWSDLAYALTPNGRTLDYRVENPYGTRGGVQKDSWNSLLYNAGLGSGYYSPPGVDPSADLTSWNARIEAGEPYDDDPELMHIADEITRFHSAYYVDDSVPPAPLFIYNAWTDDLFPADEAVRYWRKIASKHGDRAEIALSFADGFGHPRAGLGGDIGNVQSRIDDLFARHLKGAAVAAAPPLEIFTQGCNGTAPEGPFSAADWDALHPGEVRFAGTGARSFDDAGGDPDNAAATDPVNGGPCRVVPATDDAAAATYRLPEVTGAGYTLAGSPTVIADMRVTGPSYAQVAARLWDVAPDGTQALVTQALYRPRIEGSAEDVFQLHPNAWHFRMGHVAKLELLGQSSPYGRASSGDFHVTVTRLELRLPVLESPDGDAISTPAANVFPPPEGRARGRSCRLPSSGGPQMGFPCPAVPRLARRR
jgi:predicted acyl esterase